MSLGVTSWPEALEGPYREALSEIRRKADDAVDPQVLLHFTDHSVDHFDRVKDRILQLASPLNGTSNELNSAEWFVVLAASYLHDVALQSPKAVTTKPVKQLEPRDLDKLRERHGLVVAAWIRSEVDPNQSSDERSRIPKLGISTNPEAIALAETVAKVCRYHTGDIPEGFEEARSVSGRTIRVKFLTYLLRLADALDMDHRRVRMKYLDRWEVSAESLRFWWWHHYVASVDIDPESQLINVQMWYPDSLDPTLVRYFADFTRQEVRRELGPARRTLRRNGIYVDLGEISWTVTDASRRLPPRSLIELISREVESNGSEGSLSPPVSGDTDGPTSWLAEWGFAGNPWTDLPTTYTSDRFVLTSDLARIFDELDKLRSSELGELRMVFGKRGFGKTSLLKSLKSRYGEDARVCYCDMTGVFSNDPRPREIFSYVFPKIVTTLSGEAVNPDNVDTASLDQTMEDWEGANPVILVDNLDRYHEEVDLNTIREFFQISQGPFQALKQRALIVISATDAWRADLESEDLNYLGPQSFMHLEEFTRAEAEELIANRLELVGKDVGEIFQPETIDLITKVSRGNPRTILQTCETLCQNSPGTDPIGPEKVRERYNTELETKIVANMLEAAENSESARNGLEALYRFNSALDRSGTEPRAGWELAQRLVEDGRIEEDRIRDDFTGPFAQIARVETDLLPKGHVEARWVPRPGVQSLLEDLEDRELTVSEVLSAYRIHPVYPKGSDLSSVGKDFQALEQQATANRHTKVARQLMDEIANGSPSATRTLFLARFILEHLLVASLQNRGISLPEDYIEIQREDELPPWFGKDEKKFYSRMKDEMAELLTLFEEECGADCEKLLEMQFINLRFVETIEKPYGERTISKEEGAEVALWIRDVWTDIQENA